ncbi:glycosyl transferase [Owenweeksia hongkongensis DSM 17368]|uniref:Glycosyl transferase n=1 Tax=Owenweeksia hongkongensis (strain DSM 17368 / CIP 108786 / JCM 12287 / NRRL B-23963 / UST20020801) TaxID=926562 RepID=G8R5M2_OWEHD|nr:glycosyltransferase family 2 protein [Owenweeksia hongkongensis]AEV34338.1 glycosyl transferase [Owenweeksia hongkongensis DSM 17368]
MNLSVEIILWVLILLVFYTYIGYGVVLYFIILIKRKLGKRSEYLEFYEPKVTLVIPCFNEEEYITEKALDSLSLDYPKSKLTILFVTDGSTDRSFEILKKIEGIEVIHEEKRGGKSAAENRAMKFVKTPVVIFCDANTMLNKACIREIVKHYKNEDVGGVAGEKRISRESQSNVSGAGEGMYWRYESWLKRLDSELYSVVGAAGELISFRSHLVEDLEEDTILDDFVQSLRVCEKGYKIVYEPKAYAVETGSENVTEELKRKIRIAAGGWQAIFRLTSLLNPFNNVILTFQYISHRVLRWSITAFALPVILVLNIIAVMGAAGVVYSVMLFAQLLFYSMAMVGWLFEAKKVRVKALFVPYYFTIMNYAVFAGALRWANGSQKSMWEKSTRMKKARGT